MGCSGSPATQAYGGSRAPLTKGSPAVQRAGRAHPFSLSPLRAQNARLLPCFPCEGLNDGPDSRRQTLFSREVTTPMRCLNEQRRRIDY